MSLVDEIEQLCILVDEIEQLCIDETPWSSEFHLIDAASHDTAAHHYAQADR